MANILNFLAEAIGLPGMQGAGGPAGIPPQMQEQAPVAPETPPETIGEEIVSTGSRPTRYDGGVDASQPIGLGNRGMIEEVIAAQQGAPERKGLFGVKGTLRDVLGTLGDALLVGSGGQQIYRPGRQQQMEQDALVDFTSNPLQAIERLAYVNPDAAAKLYDNFSQNENRKAVTQAQTDARVGDLRNKGMTIYSQALRGMNKDNYRPELLSYIAKQYGLDPEVYTPPAEYTPDLASALQATGTPVTVQETADYRRAGMEQKERLERMKESGRNKRDNPPAPPRKTNPTNASIAEPLLQKSLQGQPLTPQEEEVLNRTGYSKDRGSGRRGSGRRSQGASGLVRQGNNLFRKNPDGSYTFVRAVN